MDPEERFISFLQFRQFSDIGFYPKDIRVECSSHFAYITSARDLLNIKHNKINLVIMDPFYEELQIAHFKSNTIFDDEIITIGDAIIGAYVQSTKGRKSDTTFDSYFWTQFPNSIVRSKMLK